MAVESLTGGDESYWRRNLATPSISRAQLFSDDDSISPSPHSFFLHFVTTHNAKKKKNSYSMIVNLRSYSTIHIELTRVPILHFSCVYIFLSGESIFIFAGI